MANLANSDLFIFFLFCVKHLSDTSVLYQFLSQLNTFLFQVPFTAYPSPLHIKASLTVLRQRQEVTHIALVHLIHLVSPHILSELSFKVMKTINYPLLLLADYAWYYPSLVSAIPELSPSLPTALVSVHSVSLTDTLADFPESTNSFYSHPLDSN